MNEGDLIARAVETFGGYAELGNEAFDAAGARFVRNRDLPLRHDANFVCRVRVSTPRDFAALYRRIEREFADFPNRDIQVDPLTPPQFIASLELEGGLDIDESLILVLEGKLKARKSDIDIRPVETEEDWQAVDALDELWWREEHRWPSTRRAFEQSLTSRRSKAPRVHVYLAYVDDKPRAFFGAYPGTNGVGQVEDLFTHPRFRHRGLATALVRACVDDARSRGAGPVIISCDPADTPKFMYEALGFRPLMMIQHFFKRVSTKT